MSTAATTTLTPNARRHATFVVLIAVFSLAFYKTLRALVTYSLNNESSSHIVLIPFVVFFLLYLERQHTFSITRTSISSGIGLTLGGVIFDWLANRPAFPKDGN
jgi:hypothetical protein